MICDNAKISYIKIVILYCLLVLVLIFTASASADTSVSNRLSNGQARRRQSQATLLSHKQNLLTGSANTPLTSPYNQFYLTNNVNSPHNGKSCASNNLVQVVLRVFMKTNIR